MENHQPHEKPVPLNAPGKASVRACAAPSDMEKEGKGVAIDMPYSEELQAEVMSRIKDLPDWSWTFDGATKEWKVDRLVWPWVRDLLAEHYTSQTWESGTSNISVQNARSAAGAEESDPEEGSGDGSSGGNGSEKGGGDEGHSLFDSSLFDETHHYDHGQ